MLSHPRASASSRARELFYRRGIHVVGVDAIAAAAGTNKMTLYRHFASKDALIAASSSVGLHAGFRRRLGRDGYGPRRRS